MRSSFDPNQNLDSTCLRGFFQRDKRGRFLPRSAGELEETLATRLAHRWGMRPSDDVHGQRLDQYSVSELRQMLRHPSQDSWQGEQDDRAERAAQRAEAKRWAMANPFVRSHIDGALEVRYCRNRRGRFLPNPPIGDAWYPWELPGNTLQNPGFSLQGRSDEILNLILERFKDPASLPAPLSQVFVKHEATHASRLSLMNQFIIAIHGESEAMGFQQWKEHGRSVKKGAKGMAILAPLARTIEVENDQGQKNKRTIIKGFKHVVVFGLSQTEGDPYQLVRDDNFLASLPFLDVAKAWGLNISTYSGGGKHLGYFAPDPGVIALGVKNAATFAHELTHAADYRLGQLNIEKYGKDKRTKSDAEIVAELGGATLLAAIGQTEAADLGGAYEYLKTWSPDDDPRIAAFRVLDRVLKSVQLIISEAQRLAGTSLAESESQSSTAPAPAAAPEPAPTALVAASAIPVGGLQQTIWNNPATSVIGLGRLMTLIIRASDGRRLRITPQDERWLAWHSTTRDLLVLRPGSGPKTLASRTAARGHRNFHGASPQSARPMMAPEPGQGLRVLGLLESLTYSAAGIASPSKRNHDWIHHFGDTGERGHGATHRDARSPYAERVMPALAVNVGGDLFIQRRPGNRYTVRDWILA